MKHLLKHVTDQYNMSQIWKIDIIGCGLACLIIQFEEWKCWCNFRLVSSSMTTSGVYNFDDIDMYDIATGCIIYEAISESRSKEEQCMYVMSVLLRNWQWLQLDYRSTFRIDISIVDNE